MTTATPLGTLSYYLSEHPSVVGFRWSHEWWGSTWSFLLASLSFYLASAAALRLLLLLRLTLPLGFLPAAHSLLMSLSSAAIFAGTALSAAAEIRDTRWLLRRCRTTPLQWLLCFPLGTRPSGRVFFWSYAFYLSRFPHALRPLIAASRRRRLPLADLLAHAAAIVTAFLWLEFSQSFQVVAILLTTLACAAVDGYRFWTAVGLPAACFPFVVSCQMALLGCNLVCHVGVLLLHLVKGGCNGIGAWVFNSVLNAAICLLFLNFYVRVHRRKMNGGGASGGLVAEKMDPVKDKDI